jgi:NAD(P)-dependent dehydrogenase (short-subunit alcohol dehydrogenase family)
MARSEAHFDVNGRTVFITGAARGIGAGAAERLYAKGANVALVGLEPERLEANAAALGDRAAAFEADVSDFDALERAVRATVERFGAIDVAIANAGISFTGPLATAPIEQVERTLSVNLLGVWRTDRAVVSHITERRGYLLNIASLAAALHTPLMGPYTTAKAGVEALSDALRMELAPSGARVGCAYFGFIDTDLVRAGKEMMASELLGKGALSALNNPAPLSTAISAIERGVERRSARVWAPRYVGAVLALRGVVQAMLERRSAKESAALVEAMRLAETEDSRADEDLELGIAARKLAPSPSESAFSKR